MRKGLCIVSIALLESVGLLSPAAAQSIDGRYLGSYSHHDVQGSSVDRMSHLYDVVIREALPRELQLDLGASLRYELEPGDLDTDILRSRVFSDVRAPSWRLHTQFVPWQRTRPASSVPRQRDLQTGFDWTPARGPQVRLNVNRADRETDLGRSRQDDRRIQVLYTHSGFTTNVGYRRLESTPAGRGTRTDTDEYRAGLRGGRAWKQVSVDGSWDAVITDRTSSVREIDQDLQRANVGARWRPLRRLTVTSHLQRRWGTTRDNGLPEDRKTRELFTGARVAYQPLIGLTVDVLREYRRSQVAAGNLTSDYMRFETLYRRAVVRGTMMQTGYAQTVDLSSRGGSAPNSTVFMNVDAALRRGLRGRAEVRALRSPTVSSGTQWRNLLQLNTQPTRITRFDILWQRDVLPEIAGAQQRDRRLELVGGSQIGAAHVVASYRRLDGEGRIERSENFWSLTSSWRMSERSTLGVDASTRETRLQQTSAKQDVLSVDLTFWPAEQSKVRTSWRRTKTRGRPRNVSWNVIFSQTF